MWLFQADPKPARNAVVGLRRPKELRRGEKRRLADVLLALAAVGRVGSSSKLYAACTATIYDAREDGLSADICASRVHLSSVLSPSTSIFTINNSPSSFFLPSTCIYPSLGPAHELERSAFTMIRAVGTADGAKGPGRAGVRLVAGQRSLLRLKCVSDERAAEGPLIVLHYSAVATEASSRLHTGPGWQ